MKCYDVEVLRGPQDTPGGWQNPEGMGFGTAVVYDDERDVYEFYAPDAKDALITSLSGNDVVSFNGVKFDNRVLLGNSIEWTPWANTDLLLKVVQGKFGCKDVLEAEQKLGDKEVHDGSIGLDGLAEGTLGMHKTGHGAHAPELIQQGKWAEVFAYNLHDVRLTWMLYEFARGYGYLIDRKGNQIRVLV